MIRACWIFIVYELVVLRGSYILNPLVGAQLKTSHKFLKENELPKTLERAGYSTEDCMGKENDGHNTHYP